ncbi:MAG TPA: hypothetical protein VK612_02865, partial [Pyrinomonadaceae bacterium]|nr:hypothetical protein [Pyrinomonadaceae bacterium]
QIVHDIHQQGATGARLFLPPYMQPVEPNVPKQIVEGYTELGNAMAADLRKKGLEGITTDSTYDAWTPARAYSHYHGGVRILSETASARLATPVNIKFEQLRGSEGYDAKKEAPNFHPVWKGGEWKMRNITDYMTTAAFSLLNHAADNREQWLSRFYEVGKEAVRMPDKGNVYGLLVTPDEVVDEILKRGGVEFRTEYRQEKDGHTEDFTVIRAQQPYFGFAKALLEKQVYPDLIDANGNPIPPYDVTAHTLSLLFDLEVEPIFTPLPKLTVTSSSPSQNGCSGTKDGQKVNNVQIYRSPLPSMDEGWTRFVFEQDNFWREHGQNCEKLLTSSITNAEIIGQKLSSTILFPDQSPNQILNGYPKGSMPDEYTGGVGKEGVENLRKFVEAGGTLVFLNRASNFAIEQFNLPVKDVTKGLARKDFFIPGSILRTELDLTHPIAKGMPKESIAWFENSPVFEIITDPLASVIIPHVSEGSTQPTSAAALTRNFRIIATYPKDPKQILLSGWALGAEKIAGKAALVEFTIGKGKIILFGFRPQYRGQSLATFPLLFNAISQ